jgi:hypothetical protein
MIEMKLELLTLPTIYAFLCFRISQAMTENLYEKLVPALISCFLYDIEEYHEVPQVLGDTNKASILC